MTAFELKNFAYVMSNLDRDTLEQAGIIRRGAVGGSDWTRFNNDPMTFILKLEPARLQTLADIISAELAPHR